MERESEGTILSTTEIYNLFTLRRELNNQISILLHWADLHSDLKWGVRWRDGAGGFPNLTLNSIAMVVHKNSKISAEEKKERRRWGRVELGQLGTS